MVAKISLILLPGMLCDSASWKPQAEALADICQISVAAYGHLDTVAAMAHNVLVNGLATDPIADMTKHGAANGTGEKADAERCERRESARERIEPGKE